MSAISASAAGLAQFGILNRPIEKVVRVADLDLWIFRQQLQERVGPLS
jgi:hypothetical protein